jgi:hypothetical protein
MHRSTVSEISSFLINEEWEVTTSATEVDVQYFGYPIDYKMITWGKNTDNSIFLFYKPGFKNIVIVQIIHFIKKYAEIGQQFQKACLFRHQPVD